MYADGFRDALHAARLAGGGGTALVAGDRIDAPLAHSRGLVDRIGDRAAALEWAAGIAGPAPLAQRYAPLALDRDDLAAAGPALLTAFETCWGSEDRDEGRRARLERRPPVFRGR